MTLSSERHFRPRAAFLAATALNPLKPLFKRALRPLVERLARAGVTANQVTIISLVGSLLSVHADGGPVWGLLPAWMLARMALATIDGMLAIDFGQKSRLGSILNEVGDVISDIAAAAGDPAWSYDSVLAIYREIENWQGTPDPARRGRDGLLYITPPIQPNPVATAMLDAATELGIPVFDDVNGSMMEGPGGASYFNLRIRDGQRQSIFRSYTFPLMNQPNLTVLPGTVVTRVLIERGAAVGVECIAAGRRHSFQASQEVILSLGAIHTPKVLMQSGVGDAQTLASLGIPIVQHLPGVGANFHDHIMVTSCIWEYPQPILPHGNGGEATIFARSTPELDSPDIQLLQIQFPVPTPEPNHAR